MSDLRLIIILLARASLSVIVSYATWVIIRAQLMQLNAEKEEPHA